jgi:hypothetical protein
MTLSTNSYEGIRPLDKVVSSIFPYKNKIGCIISESGIAYPS